MAKAPSLNPSPMNRPLVIFAALIGVIALIAGLMWFVTKSGDNGPKSADSPYALTVTDEVITIGGSDNTIDIYEDFTCPKCSEMHVKHGEELFEKVAAGELTVNYHFLNFLDPKTASGDYSTRAAAAVRCVADTGNGEDTKTMISSLMEHQPQAVTTSDLSSADISGMYQALVGENADVQDCIASNSKYAETQAAAEAGNQKLSEFLGGSARVPTVVHDNQSVQLLDAQWVNKLTQ